MNANKYWILPILMLVLGASLFIARGPLRSIDETTNLDAMLVPLGARVWLEGGNPYDPDRFGQEWVEDGGSEQMNPARRGRHAMVYPVGAYVLMTWIGALDLSLWRPVWNIMNILLFLVAVILTLKLAELPVISPAGVTSLGLALAMAPSHTSIAIGQTGIIVFFLIVLSKWLSVHATRWGGGVVLGASVVFKPQTGVFFFIYELWRGRWQSVFGALAAIVFLMGFGLFRLFLDGVNPLPDWIINAREIGSISSNPFSEIVEPHQLINAAASFHWLLGPDAQFAAILLAFVTALAVSLTYWRVDHLASRRGIRDECEMISLSMVAVVALVTTYHRLYDATLLVIPLALGVRQLAAGDRRGWVTLLLLFPFLLPAGSILSKLQTEYGLLPQELMSSKLWVVGIMMHQNWVLIMLSAWLIYLRVARYGTGPSVARRS